MSLKHIIQVLRIYSLFSCTFTPFSYGYKIPFSIKFTINGSKMSLWGNHLIKTLFSNMFLKIRIDFYTFRIFFKVKKLLYLKYNKLKCITNITFLGRAAPHYIALLLKIKRYNILGDLLTSKSWGSIAVFFFFFLLCTTWLSWWTNIFFLICFFFSNFSVRNQDNCIFSPFLPF